MIRINEAIQKKINACKPVKADTLNTDKVVAMKPTMVAGEEQMEQSAENYENVVDERQKETDGIVPDEKKMKAHLDESLFENYIQEADDVKKNNDADLYTSVKNRVFNKDNSEYEKDIAVDIEPDSYDEERLVIASDSNSIGDYDVGVYTDSKKGEELISKISKELLLNNSILKTKNSMAKRYPYIHVIRIPENLATMSLEEYKKKYDL